MIQMFETTNQLETFHDQRDQTTECFGAKDASKQPKKSLRMVLVTTSVNRDIGQYFLDNLSIGIHNLHQ